MAFPLLFGTTPGSKGWIIYINRNSAQNFPQFCSYFLIRIDREVSEESTRMLCFRYVAIGRKIWAFPLRGRDRETVGSPGWIISTVVGAAQNFPQFCSYFLISIDREASEESTRMLCFRYVAIGR